MATGNQVEAGIVDATPMQTDAVQTTKEPFADQMRFSTGLFLFMVASDAVKRLKNIFIKIIVLLFVGLGVRLQQE